MPTATVQPVNIRFPRAVSRSFTALEVAKAYRYPTGLTGKGFTVGIIELGGAVSLPDLRAYCSTLGIPAPDVTSVAVDGAKITDDGPDGASGEVNLDVQVVAGVAPGAAQRVYFAPNTDRGFLHAIEQACAECDVVSISWGGPENSWSPQVLDQYDAVFRAARANGVIVFAASGDTGSRDGTAGDVVDFPASSPNVVGCGGTKLITDAAGARSSEVTWDEDDLQSATGGGVSSHFAGRQVPDVAGNADPSTGYEIRLAGREYVIGGTSAVAPLYAGLALLLSEALGQRLGARIDFLNMVLTNPQCCYDVTIGDNGGYKAGPGRDKVTGFGVVDGGMLLARLTDNIADPAPIPGGNPPGPVTPVPAPVVPPAPAPEPTSGPTPQATYEKFRASFLAWAAHPFSVAKRKALLADGQAYISAVDGS
jgi:kumamolisin